MSDSSAEPPKSTDQDRPVPITGFERRFKHPIGLVILFFAEMWERFSYYGMRGLLRLYMANYLFSHAREVVQGCSGANPPCGHAPGEPELVMGWRFLQGLLPTSPGEQASVLYGWYTGLVYLTPFFGGIIADRFIGQRKSVYIGGALMAVGHFVMALENSFFLALILLILGNGFFKPNISTQVGNLYKDGDPRRDGAFTIFYMGINLGAFLCSFVCGTLAAVYGWHYGFGAAGVGMVLGLIVYLLGQKHLAPDNVMKKAAAAAGGAGKALGAPAPADEKQPVTKEEWRRIGALIALFTLNIIFWMVYEQQGNSMQEWADKQTVWPKIGSFQVPSTWFQSFNPFIIFIFGIPLDMFWAWQAKRGKEPTSVSKMAIGCALLGLSFIIMVIGARVIGEGKGSLLWPLGCTFIITIGELYLSPIGLSLVTKVAPKRLVSMMMGLWLGSSFLGNLGAGYIGVLYERWSHEAFFTLLSALGLAAAAAMWAFNRPLKKVIGNA
ncbi:MAG: peptide MFS transporter [Polyangiaceae bacterium]